MRKLAERELRAPNDLAADCERALVASARTHGAGTRQQLRAAARRFVRRHRRDAGFLRWVLRSVVSSAALAVALLGFATEPAYARAPTLFISLTGASNPLGGQDVGRFSTTAFGDLDGDGDLDLAAGTSLGTFVWFENTGSATSPAFTPRTGAQNPLDGLDAGLFSAPTLGDLDGDGDLDLVAGQGDGGFVYFENTGDATSPSFLLQTGSANPLDDQDVGDFSAPSLGDLDGDGDLDLVAGEFDGSFRYFENTGGATSPVFVLRTGAQNPLDGQDAGAYSAPALGDLDGDGDLDLVAGEYSGVVAYLENTGSATSPTFAARSGAANPLDGEDVGYDSAPALGDLDGDGDLDLVAGEFLGSFLTFQNCAGSLMMRTGAHNPLDGEDLDIGSAPAFGDLDGDGDLDLVVGTRFDYFFYFENTGSAASPAFISRTGAANPLAGQGVGYYASPALGDLDADGDLDLVAGEFDGFLNYFENTGSATSPAFIPRTGSANPLDGQDLGFGSAPALGDVDEDGDLDLVAGNNDGLLLYFENTGSASTPSFTQQTGASNPFDGQDVGNKSAPALGDLDGDGDLDLVAGEFMGGLFYFENRDGKLLARTASSNPLHGQNVGNFSTPALGDLDGDGDLDLVVGDFYATFFYFENGGVKPSLFASERMGSANPLSGQQAGSRAKPALGDLDGDGDLDLVAGEYYGTFAWFENTGTATSPACVPVTGAANPLDGQDAGGHSASSLGDLDGDGDLDLVAGEEQGGFFYFENTGSATSPSFVSRTGEANPLDGLDAGFESTPALGDLDGDGDLDLVAGELYGGFAYFENTGSATSPAFVPVTGGANPLDGQDVGFLAAASLGDVDGDGDLDLVSGENDGRFFYFENTGNATSPSFVARTGAANPFANKDAGNLSGPSLGDLDGDGDLDLVGSEGTGTFHSYYLPEPAQGLLLGAGLALLSLLERLRGRRRRRT